MNKRQLLTSGFSAVIVVVLGSVAAAQDGSLMLERDGRIISLVPYAPNVLRVTMSVDKAAATAAPGYVLRWRGESWSAR